MQKYIRLNYTQWTIVFYATDVNIDIFSGWEAERFVLETERRNKIIEECSTVSGYHEFSASRTCRKARFGSDASQTTNPNSPKTGHFSHRTTPMPCPGSCSGNPHKQTLQFFQRIQYQIIDGLMIL